MNPQSSATDGDPSGRPPSPSPSCPSRVGRHRDRGAIAVEFVLLLPVLMLLLGVVVGGARIWWARTGVQQLASSAARQASIARTASEATANAQRVVATDVSAAGLRCVQGAQLTLDVAAFGRPAGQPGTVSATIRCVVPLADLVLPGMPGNLTVDASSSSTLDRFRGRS